ncbi:hypothetical protein ACVMHY_004413 [Bradyrhizobium barranii subsp. barranii]
MSTLTLHCSAIVLQPSQRWKGITMRKTLLALAAVATLAVSAASPAYAGPRYDYGPGGNPYPRTYPGPGGYPYWSGYVDAPVGEPIPPLPLDNPALLGRAWLARTPRAHLRLIRSRLFRLSVFGPWLTSAQRAAMSAFRR